MNNTLKALNDLREAWKRLRAARPNDKDMSQWIPGLTAEGFENRIAGWIADVHRVVNGTRSSLGAEPLMDVMTAGLIRDAIGLVNSAQGNGIGWLMGQPPFKTGISTAAILMETLSGRKISVQRGLAKLVESRLNEDIQAVGKAAPLAKEIIDHYPGIAEHEEQLRKVVGEIEEIAKSVADLKSAAESDSASVSTLHAEVDQDRKSVQSALDAAKAGLAEAQHLIEEVRGQKADADSAVAAATETLKETHDRLVAALHDVNKQALAGAFHKKAEEVGKERWLWVGGFLIALAWLIGVGMVTKAALVKNDAVDWIALLQGLSLAAPGIWLGWYASKQSSMLARIKHDYDYKTATAYAFEGYRKEVDGAENGPLKIELLETAIRSFGENPIRLYRHQKDDHGHPIETLLAGIKDHDTLKKLLEVITALKPNAK